MRTIPFLVFLSGIWSLDLHATSSHISIYFGGHQIDNETGLVYAQNRYYHPELGDFTTADPLYIRIPRKCIESVKECDLYSYVSRNPVNRVDPDGLDDKKPTRKFSQDHGPASRMKAKIVARRRSGIPKSNNFAPGEYKEFAKNEANRPESDRMSDGPHEGQFKSKKQYKVYDTKYAASGKAKKTKLKSVFVYYDTRGGNIHHLDGTSSN